jgi:hypothetical protein
LIELVEIRLSTIGRLDWLDDRARLDWLDDRARLD